MENLIGLFIWNWLQEMLSFEVYFGDVKSTSDDSAESGQINLGINLGRCGLFQHSILLPRCDFCSRVKVIEITLITSMASHQSKYLQLVAKHQQMLFSLSKNQTSLSARKWKQKIYLFECQITIYTLIEEVFPTEERRKCVHEDSKLISWLAKLHNNIKEK